MQRREYLKSITLAGAFLATPTDFIIPDRSAGSFSYCLNTSTISGQKPGFKAYFDLAARAGYQGIEIWIRDLQSELEAGTSLNTIKKQVLDSGLRIENAIGFAPWMVNDASRRKEGFDQMKQEMELLAEVGCTRVAAPAAGITAGDELDLFEIGERYDQLIEVGRQTGVMPQLEFWGAHPKFYHLGQALMVAAVANNQDVRFLPDVYHLFRGGSGFEGLKMLDGSRIEIFHMNDYPDSIVREKQTDADRVYPGDGVAPISQILTDLKNMGGTKVLSLELFNREYWQQDALKVAKTGLEKMKKAVKEIS